MNEHQSNLAVVSLVAVVAVVGLAALVISAVHIHKNHQMQNGNAQNIVGEAKLQHRATADCLRCYNMQGCNNPSVEGCSICKSACG